MGSIFGTRQKDIEVFITDVERFKKLKYLCAGAGKRVNSYLRALTAETHMDGEQPGKSPWKRVRRRNRKAR